jgi:hypothetical protein
MVYARMEQLHHVPTLCCVYTRETTSSKVDKFISQIHQVKKKQLACSSTRSSGSASCAAATQQMQRSNWVIVFVYWIREQQLLERFLSVSPRLLSRSSNPCSNLIRHLLQGPDLDTPVAAAACDHCTQLQELGVSCREHHYHHHHHHHHHGC